MFDVPPGSVTNLLLKLERVNPPTSFRGYSIDLHINHSFIVLGKDSTGKYVCFQKEGPKIENRFEITELNSILKANEGNSRLWGHLSFIGPIN